MQVDGESNFKFYAMPPLDSEALFEVVANATSGSILHLRTIKTGTASHAIDPDMLLLDSNLEVVIQSVGE
jgi:hypothetical protein